MSLLDDVSIVVTPNAYKAGELYAVIPVPSEGAELLSQPVNLVADFVNNAGGVIVDADTFTTAGGTFDGLVSSTNTFEIGKRYKLIISGNTTSSGLGFYPASGSGNYGEGFGTHYFTASNQKLWIRQVTAGTTNITSFSIKEYTSADMDVTRATAATRVDENGLVNYAEVLGGEEIDLTIGSTTEPSNWGSITTNGISYLAQIGTVEYYDTGFTVTSGITYKLTFTLSNYTGSNNLGFSGSGGVSSYARLDADGSYSEYFIASSSVELRMFGRNTATGVFTNVSVKEVTRDNVPRIDYTGGGCPHILAEPQRTNLVTYSEDFSNASWAKTNSSITSNLVISPDGSLNGDKLVENTSNNYHYISHSFSIVSGSYYSFSIFLKKGERKWLKIDSSSGASWSCGANFDLENGVVGSIDMGSAKIESYGNDWYRCSIIGLANATTVVASDLILGIGDNNNSYQGDGTSGLYLYGGQVEQGSYPTSYIPTSGSSVTRNQDIFTRDGIGSLINSTEGVLFLEVAALSIADGNRYITLTNGAVNSYGIRILYQSASGSIFFQKYVNGTRTTNVATSSITTTNLNKLAIRYNTTNVDIWVNGVEILTNSDTNLIPSGTLNRLAFDIGDGSSNFFGKVKQLQVYDTSLTDNQLIQLTGEAGTHFFESYAEMAEALTYTIQ